MLKKHVILNINLTLVTNSLKDEHLKAFIDAYKADDVSKREETERFKRFSYDEIITRDKTNLDITWIKDESLESLENLPEPEVLADEIISSLEDALNDFKGIEK